MRRMALRRRRQRLRCLRMRSEHGDGGGHCWSRWRRPGRLAPAPSGGPVRDESGGAIPGAQVRVVNIETGVATDAVTNADAIVPRAGPDARTVSRRVAGSTDSETATAAAWCSKSTTPSPWTSRSISPASRRRCRCWPHVLARRVARSSTVTQTVTREMLGGAAAAEPGGLVARRARARRGHDRPGRAPRKTIRCSRSPAAGRATRFSSSTAAMPPTPSGSPAPAADQPAGRRDAGVPGHHQQLRRGVRAFHRRRVTMSTRSGTNTFHGSVSSRSAMTLSTRETSSPVQAADPAEPVRRHARRPARQRQDVLLRHLGADRQLASYDGRLHRAYAAEPAGDFSDLRNRLGRADPHLRPADPAAVSGQRRSRATGSIRWRWRRSLLSAAEPRGHGDRREQLRRQQLRPPGPRHRRRPRSTTRSARPIG